MPRRLIPFLLAALLLVAGPAVTAQAQDEPVQENEQQVNDQQDTLQVTEDFPATFEVSSQYRSLVDDALEAEEQIEELSSVVVLEDELETAENRQREIERQLTRFVDIDYVRSERIAHLRTQAVSHNQSVEAAQEQAVSRLEELEQMRTDWTERRQFWESWRESLEHLPEFTFVEPEFDRALDRIDRVLERIDEAVPNILEYQSEINALQTEAQALISQVVALQAGGREARLVRGQPVLFSGPFISDLRAGEWQPWRPVTALQSPDYTTFLADNATYLFFHLILALLLGLAARRMRSLAIQEAAWSGLLLRPWALAVFASTVLLFHRYVLPPPLWDVLMWAIMAGTGTILARRLFKRPSMRAVIYFFAAFYPAFLFAEAIQLPIPLFRIALFATALSAVLLFAGFFQSLRRSDESSRIELVLGLAAVVWALVLIAETLGFYLFSRWLLHVSINSAFVVLVAGFLFVISRDAVRTVVRMESSGRLGSIGIPVVERFLKLIQFVIVIGGLLIVLNIWELTPPPGETWAAITSVGFMMAGVEISLGRLLLAALLIYITILGSWLVRTFARTELYPRWELERGVGDSINSLVHYALIALGVVLGLGALGVGLQNFAIVAGALGVGIGFGLQNIVNNFVSGLILLFERPVRVGDTVMIDEEFGVIDKIGLRATNVVTFDRSELIVPNSDLVSQKVVNWTLTDPVVRMIIPVGVAYGTDVEQVRAILLDVAKNHPAVMDDPEPAALFLEFGDSSLDFELRIWIQDLRERMRVKSAILSTIEQAFADADVEVPFPQRDLHVRSIQEDIMDASKVLSGNEDPPEKPEHHPPADR